VNLRTPATWRTDVLFVLATLGITALAGGVAAAPHLLSREPTARELASLVEERRDTAEKLASQSAEMSSKVARMREEAERAVRLESANAANVRLEQLASAAQRNGVTITQISSQAADTSDVRAAVIPIRISGTATYTRATEFVRELRANFRDTAVTGMKISGVPAAGPKPPEGELKLDLAWYAEPDKGAVRAGSGASGASAGGGAKTP
jgi:hypothetical protein